MFRYLGVNTHEESVMNYISKRPELFDMVLLYYNVLQLDREPIINKLHKFGIGVIAGTVLAQGHLVKGKIGSFKTRLARRSLPRRPEATCTDVPVQGVRDRYVDKHL